MSEQARARAKEQILERIIELQVMSNDLTSENEQFKKNLPEYTRIEAIQAIERRMADNKDIISDTKKDIDALLKVIDTLSN